LESKSTKDVVKECSPKSKLWSRSDKKDRSIKNETKRSHDTKNPVIQLNSAEKENSNPGIARTQETTVEEVMRKPPADVDMNDFILKAGEANTVVHPKLVRKGGNIDDANAATKPKLRLILDEEMKTREQTIESDDKEPFDKAIKWGDTKCVVYETRGQVTLEDEPDDTADLP
ncbi:hypothetical protein DICVIV_02977, partial [Dictyocaulus viviparus]